MLRLLLSHSMFRIQYSDGIRPSLLATLSLSVNIGGSNHYQLIHSLQKNNIVQCSFVLEALHSLDRQSFTSVPFPYKNIPYRIHSDENMTDILTHAIILQHLSPFLCRNFLNILDIGTGHGYLAFAMAKILLFKGYTHFRITGLDSSLQSVTECQRLNEIFVCGQYVSFKCSDVNAFLKNNDEQFDIVVAGFYCQPNLTRKLLDSICQQGIGLWATFLEDGQALFRFSRDSSPYYIMDTFFSQPCLDSDPVLTVSLENENLSVIKQNMFSFEQQKRARASEQNRHELKELLLKHRKPNGSFLSLSQMEKIPEIASVLIKLKIR